MPSRIKYDVKFYRFCIKFMADFKRVVVSTTKDLSAENNGDGTLRKAIQEANNRIANDLAKTIENTK